MLLLVFLKKLFFSFRDGVGFYFTLEWEER